LSISKEIESFHLTISANKIHVVYLPPIILVFGGIVDVKLAIDCSCRNLFLTEALRLKFPYGKELKIPESYPEWNTFEGYQNLIDFETDAGCLSRAIVLFLESPGSLAELGAFCMDDDLRRLLFIVVEEEHYTSDSFIKLGPIKKIENDDSGDSICVVPTLEKPAEFATEIPDILVSLKEKLDKGHKKQGFDCNRNRDKYLLIADLIDLFCAVNVSELHTLAINLGMNLATKDIKRILRQLILFELVSEVPINTHKYYVANKGYKTDYLDYNSAIPEKKFDRTSFKLQMYELLNGDALRKRAYAQVHGVASK